jgi:WD40 repeat protein
MKQWQAHRWPVRGLAFAPGGGLLATAGDNKVRLWEAHNLTACGELACLTAQAVTFSPDGRFLAATGYEYSVLGDWPEIVRVWPFGADGVRRWPTQFYPNGHSAALAFAPDGRLALRTNLEFLLDQVMWVEPEMGVIRDTWEGMPGHGGAVAVSPDGLRVAVPSLKRLVVYAAADRQVLIDVPLPTEGQMVVAYSPDGRFLACGTAAKVGVWDAVTHEPVGVLSHGRRHVRAIAWHPNGPFLVAALRAGTAVVWDVEAGKVRQELALDIGPLESVAVAPDGFRVAVGGRGQVAVWDWEL